MKKGKYEKHGMCRTRFYKIWENMKWRCTNEKLRAFKNYGAKGISVVWGSFQEFKDDMYEPYLRHAEIYGEKNTTIDRIDNDGNYCKENCRWATRTVQGQNTSRIVMVTIDGKTHSFSEWCRKKKIPPTTIYSRMSRFSISAEKALLWEPNKYLPTKFTRIKRCCWCKKFVGSNGKATIKEPDIFYCHDCYRKGLEAEYEAMGLYDYSLT